MNKFRFVLVGLFLLLLGSVFTLPSLAQDCPNVVIDNSSNFALNREAICQAARPWTQQFLVYVYLTDFQPANEDEWFARLDAFESAQGIYVDGLFLRTAVAFEASTARPNLYAANITIGDALANTPLWDDSNREDLKAEFRNALASGDYTAAFVQVMGSAYQTAFPPPPPTQPPQPTAPPVPTAVIVQGPVTNVQVDTAPVVNGIGTLLVIAVVVIAGGAAVYYIGLPLARSVAISRQRFAQIRVIADRVDGLLLAVDNLLKGSSITDSPLYMLWSTYGGPNYTERDAQVQGWLQSAKQTLDRSFELFNQLKANKTLSVEAQVKAWETLYLTLVGTSERILSMTLAEQETLLNPLLVVEEEDVNDDLRDQIEEVFRELEGDGSSLRIELMAVSAQEVNEQGILGYMDSVKSQLSELKRARQEVEPKLAEVKERLQSTEASFQFQPELTADDALAFPRQELTKADEAVANELWLNAKTHVDIAADALVALPDLITQYYAGVHQAKERLVELEAVRNAGFDLTVLNPLVAEVTGDFQTFTDFVRQGNFAKATEYLGELDADSQAALQGAKDLQSLHQQNQERLGELSQKVAKVQKFLDQKAKPALEALQAYPESNWGEAPANFQTAVTLVAEVFDDPANADDLASRIETLNSLQEQDFGPAERQLTEALAQAKEAQRLGQSVLDQLELVQTTEQNLQAAIDVAKKELQKAQERRNAENAKVTKGIDALLDENQADLARAEELFSRREFTEASVLVEEVRENATYALAEVDKQAREIDDALDVLGDLRAEAKDLFQDVTEANQELVKAAQTDSIAGIVAEVQDALKRAQTTDQTIQGKEDEEWLKAINEVTHLYREMQTTAHLALDEIEAADRQYQTAWDAARAAIRSADQAIQEAEQLVAHPDASSAGSDALSRARSARPSMVGTGATYEALQRVVSQAQQAEEAAQRAAQAAQAAINRVEAERERERQRRRREQEAREARERAAAAAILAEQQRQAEARRAEQRRRDSSSNFGGGFGSSNRSSNFGSTTRSSSFGSRSSNSSNFGSRKR